MTVNPLSHEAQVHALAGRAAAARRRRLMRATVGRGVILSMAVLGALIGLYFTHQTLNAMTLGGIAVVIGLLIDESIVVLENTARHLDSGTSPREAALIGASEVMRPLTIVTITISVVFFPIVFMGGIGKFLFMPLAIAVIFAIWTSRLLASTFVPVCAARFFARTTKANSPSPQSSQRSAQSRSRGGGREAPGGGWFEHLRDRYARALDRVLQLRSHVLGATAALFILSMFVFKLIGSWSRKSKKQSAQSSRKGSAR